MSNDQDFQSLLQEFTKQFPEFEVPAEAGFQVQTAATPAAVGVEAIEWDWKTIREWLCKIYEFGRPFLKDLADKVEDKRLKAFLKFLIYLLDKLCDV